MDAHIRLSNSSNANFSFLASDSNGLIRIAGNAGTGLGYHNGASFTEVMRVESATGAVGIGTSLPASGFKLDVNGAVRVGHLPASNRAASENNRNSDDRTPKAPCAL